MAIRLASLFFKKASLWLEGRQYWKKRHLQLSTSINRRFPLIWIHCASLGEFEQGRPIIELLKKEQPDCQILLSFFSPSGYEIRKNYEVVDAVVYLPIDTPSNAKAFLDIWKPDMAIFVKYEFWYYHFKALYTQKIPTLLVAALFRSDQLFFKWYGGPFREMLTWLDHIFVQNQESANQVSKIGIQNWTVCGDPRVDRVANIADSARHFPELATFVEGSNILVAGSTWPEDETILLPLLNKHWQKGWKAIIAPHNINNKQISQFIDQLDLAAIRYSDLSTKDNLQDIKVLIIDNIGMLSSLYQFGKIAYIGGAFRTGLHNTLEPIAFGLPVIFGPKYHKFEEARYLVESGGGYKVVNIEELVNVFNNLSEDQTRRIASQKAKAYIQKNQGSSKVIITYIFKNNKLE